MWVFLGLLGTASASVAAEPQLHLQRFLTDVRTLSARFEQVQLDEDGSEVTRRGGTLELARPGRFRWQYETPYEQLMICDGVRIWNYEPDLQQATVREAGQILRDTPVALLAEGADLASRFDIVDAGSSADGRALRLTPKTAEADFRLIELWLRDSGEPTRMRLHDPLGGTSEIRFTAVQRNLKLDDSRFRFKPPQGTEVVDLE